MNNYVVTNIRLAEEDYLRLKEEAAKKRTSFSAVIREKIGEKRLSREEWVKKLLTLNTDWFDYKEFKKNRVEMEKRVKKNNW